MELYLLSAVCITIITIHTCRGFDCTGKDDGAYEASCQTFTKCLNGTASLVECQIPLVVNEETLDCDDALKVKSPCGMYRDCSFRDDGGYPDMEYNCHWYYMCSYEIFYGHHKCSAGTVWNTRLQTCDFATNVNPPCGTRT